MRAAGLATRAAGRGRAHAGRLRRAEEGRRGPGRGDRAAGAAARRRARGDRPSCSSRRGRGAREARSHSSTGAWRGCESGGLEEFKNFQLPRRRPDRRRAGAAARPTSTGCAPVFEEAGFGALEPGRAAGRCSTLRAERDDVTASFSELPDQGDYVLLTVGGPCIDVPEDERDDWLPRDEPTPDIR